MHESAALEHDTVLCGPLVAGGDSLVRRAGKKTLFVEGAIPGEQVEVAIHEHHNDHARGRVINVLHASDDRVDEPCPMRKADCGGCQWQHIAFPAHHSHKTGMVIDALTRIAKSPDADVSFVGSVDPFEYRTTMRLPVVDGRAALHIRGSNETVQLDTCLIAHPLLRDLIAEGRYPNATEVRLRAGVASGERLAWVTGTDDEPELPDDVTVTHNGRKAFVHETVAGFSFQVSARAFFQSGPQAAELLAATVDRAVPTGARMILDAYSGIGVLGRTVAARRDAQLITIESDGASVNDAKVNLEDIDARIILGEVAAVRPGDVAQPDVVIADPARSGLGPSASRALAALGAPRIVLVSCDPASLARDITLLRKRAYELQSVEVLDLFPNTHHVETVTVFNRVEN